MKRIMAIGLSLLVGLFALAGCSEDTQDSGEQKERDRLERNSDEDSSSQDQEQEVEESEEESSNDSLKVYVPNEDATALVEVEVDSEEADGATKEEIVIGELKKTDTGNEDYRSAIREDIEVNSVTVDGDMAIVDLDGENLMGSGVEESFLIDSVVMSLTSLDGINSVQFLVDGEKRDSLMGHFEIGFPLTADDVGNNISE